MANGRELEVIGKAGVPGSFRGFITEGKVDIDGDWERTDTEAIKCNSDERIDVDLYQLASILNSSHGADPASVGVMTDQAFAKDYMFSVGSIVSPGTVAGKIIRSEVCGKECGKRCAIVKAREEAMRSAK